MSRLPARSGTIKPLSPPSFAGRRASGTLFSPSIRIVLSSCHAVLDLHDYWHGKTTPAYAQRYSGTLIDQLAHLAPILRMTASHRIPLFIGEWGVPNAPPNGN